MTGSPPPRAFISHSSLDKDRFVTGFATRLRAGGVDGWLDDWEMRAGDSLVTKIFDEGIGGAEFVIVVISTNSLGSKWVQEEMNTAVVRRIEGTVRLIPVILDGVEPPVALSSLLQIRVADPDSYNAEFARTLNAIFETKVAPPIGAPPRHLTAARVPGVTTTDAVVLQAICEEALRRGHVLLPSMSDVYETCAAADVDAADVMESALALDQAHLLSEVHTRGETVEMVKLAWNGLITYLNATRPGMGAIQQRLIAEIVNERPKFLAGAATAAACEPLVAEALLQNAVGRRLLTLDHVMSGDVYIDNVSPLLRRELNA